MARNFAGAGAVISAAFALLVAAPTPAQTASAPDIPEATFRAILECLSHGKEIVMVPQLDCVSRLRGGALAQEAHMPLGAPGWNGDWDEVCRNESDPRRLPATIIKRIAAQKEVPIAPTGIRIIGAVFCGDPNTAGLDLAGLDLTYSLVIDRSVVNGFLDARNLRVKGDFSFENAVILGSLRLNRARVEGSVYGNKSFIDRLLVNDTQINGTWWHREAVVFSDAEIVRANISGDLNLETVRVLAALDSVQPHRRHALSEQLGGALRLSHQRQHVRLPGRQSRRIRNDADGAARRPGRHRLRVVGPRGLRHSGALHKTSDRKSGDQTNRR